MDKRKITDRLQLLNDGRTHYLEFLRNLTPQIILFSVTLLLMVKLDFTRIDLNNKLQTALFFFLLGAFALAFYANATIFYGRCFAGLLKWRSDLSESLRAQDIKGHRLFVAKLRAIWDERLVEVLEVIVVFWFFQIALALVIAMSLHQATSILQGIHHAG
jgi:hypothetical protein